jgi:hypothetical protein
VDVSSLLCSASSGSITHVCAVLAVLEMAAGLQYLPARRAAAVDPMGTLTAE